ncbi:MAG: penicillin-binding transpeptidase domain-containing protein [Patescibacteria group bacterium]|nr:penicillin-binding transpeptidase domain-containing protein [Patescibacteria group bacterium]MCL5261901.1 penicillin-binding transpeptidase domain-containing protein [Patescibacteria group bacterium]
MKFKDRFHEINFDEITLDTESSRGFSVTERGLDGRIFIAIGGAAVVIAGLLFLRTGFLSVVKNKAYSERADANINKVIVEPAPRGIILDRYGKPMVANTPILSVYLRPAELIKQNELSSVLEALAKLGVDQRKLFAILNQSNLQESDTVLIKKDISNAEAIGLKGMGLDSLIVADDFKRVFSKAFSHVVGYTGLATAEDVSKHGLSNSDTVGKTGLEAQFDESLRGVNGRMIVRRNVKGESLEEKSLTEPKIGSDLKTTIDAELQEYFYKRLEKGIKDLDLREGGAGIAFDPKNGEILSLVSYPSFTLDEIPNLLNDPKTPILNRAVMGKYAPASTVKPFLAVAALKEGIIKPTDLVYSSGVLEVPNPYHPDQPTLFPDWKPHGWIDLYAALARSSNIFFYAVGGGLPYNEDLIRGESDFKGLGMPLIEKYLKLFGFNEKTGVEIPGETTGFIPSPTTQKERTGIAWRLGDTYHVSIGHGDLMISLLELVRGYAAIVNGGTLYRPHVVFNSVPEVARDLTYLAPEMQTVLHGMSDAVYKSYGTCTSLANLAYKSVAKTGSASILDNKKINAIFVGCGPMPVEDYPSVCILVLAENAKTSTTNAVPIGHDVLDWYYKNRVNDSSISKTSETVSE